MRVLFPRRSLAVTILMVAAIGATTGGAAHADGGQCDPVAASRTLNSAPLSADDGAWVRPGEPVRVDVIANDIDFDGDPLVVESVTTPNSGTASVQDNQIVFIADDDLGPVNFQYRVGDGACGIATATVRVTVSKEDEPADMADPPTPVTSVPDFAG